MTDQPRKSSSLPPSTRDASAKALLARLPVLRDPVIHEAMVEVERSFSSATIEEVILAHLDDEPTSRDGLAEAVRLTDDEVGTALTLLELRGAVRLVGGLYYALPAVRRALGG